MVHLQALTQDWTAAFRSDNVVTSEARIIGAFVRPVDRHESKN